MAEDIPAFRAGVISIPYKYIALVLLMVQTSAVILTLRFSRTTNVDGEQYIATTAVVMSELFKMVASVFLLCYERQWNFSETFSILYKSLTSDMKDTMLLGVPAGLYTLQNNLLFIALSNLDAATYQVTYQLKILTTALFSVTMLGRSLDSTKWFSLFLLTGGVALVQMPASTGGEKATVGNPFVGFIAVLSACCLSGFAGVYFEKLVKGGKSSVWLQNFHLGMFSIVLGFGGALFNDYAPIQEKGFFVGYNAMVWIVISLQAFGGLIVAAVIKYADNILKTFANALSILQTAVLSFLILHDFTFTSFFFVGSTLVIIATYLYSAPAPKPKVTQAV